ncbi:MAG TPA: TetR/AcrR family transcriptional regulator [Anaerolineales bacterium]|nr:TetR/AcrR family transcriptional regulator [Anaerolineales bacterium]
MATASYHHGDLKNALIKAGVKILAKEGVSGLSLRKVAKQAGVSHAAPYSHFADKQALIAAISTEGFRQLYKQIASVREAHQDPSALLLETARAYIQFAMNEPDRFKLMFSSVIEKEKDYPEFVTVSQENFQQLVEVVEVCQRAGLLKSGSPDLMAISVWSSVHGMIMLVLEEQVSHTVLNKYDIDDILKHTLNLLTQKT